MLITLPNGGKAKLVGDVHLGLKFEVGVPLHRRGEREASQFQHFLKALDTPGVSYNIMVGDLFEHPYVSHKTVVDAAEAYLTAADANRSCHYIALAGNHDRPRTAGVGAWESFTSMVGDRLENLDVISRPELLDEFIFLPWEWDVSTDQQVADLLGHISDPEYMQTHIAIGHCDLKSYGGDDSHLYPTKALAEKGCTTFYGGHYHTAGIYKVSGHVVHCTGSLEPYSHGEDPEGEIYVTVPLADVEANPSKYKDKAVRVLIERGQELPSLDCLALTPMWQDKEAVELPQINTDGFDLKATLANELKQVDDKDVVTFINDRL